MGYTELVKNFNRIRDYIREFYIYGFKSREEYTRKSARSYDDERRRIDSWMGDYMKSRQTAEGKNVFLSIDSRVTHHNPLYKAWKVKSFTDGDITLHFILMDIMEVAEEALPVHAIMEKMDVYLSTFPQPRMFDESTVRKKLKEYVKEGILKTEKKGKTLYYKKASDRLLCDKNILDFFSETVPCGVIGSFLLDQKALQEENEPDAGKIKDRFGFKHHYITSAVDSEILYQLFEAMHEKRNVVIKTAHRDREKISENKVVPLQVLISVQSGRQYLMAYTLRIKKMSALRIDNILSVKSNTVNEHYDEIRKQFEEMKPHIWGVSTQNSSGKKMEIVEFTVHYEKGEEYIHHRLEREKRCGYVEKIDAHTSRFYAEVYNAWELIPWIRTFICRITDIHISNPELEADFKNNLESMYELYGIGGEEHDL